MPAGCLIDDLYNAVDTKAKFIKRKTSSYNVQCVIGISCIGLVQFACQFGKTQITHITIKSVSLQPTNLSQYLRYILNTECKLNVKRANSYWQHWIINVHTNSKCNKKAEAATRGVLCKKVFLKISQNSQGNTCARVSFLIGLQLY